MGYHYPRSKATRVQTAKGFLAFVERYPDLLIRKGWNFYGISAVGSLMDWDTYLDVLRASGLPFDLADPAEHGFSNLSGLLTCDEMYVDAIRAERFFTERLVGITRFGTDVSAISQHSDSVTVNGTDGFDHIIDCTYGALHAIRPDNIRYEGIDLALFEDITGGKDFSYVIMDGTFQSLTPWPSSEGKRLYSLYDVLCSPVVRSETFARTEAALHARGNGSGSHSATELGRLTERAEHYFPEFNKAFRYRGKASTVRVTLDENDANRSCIVQADRRVVKVFSGKINSVFHAAEEVIRILGISEHNTENKAAVRDIRVPQTANP